MELERILFLLRHDGWHEVRDKEFHIVSGDKSWWARVYRPHGFAPYLIEVAEVYYKDAQPYLKTGNYFYLQTESEYETFSIAEIRDRELRLFELVDLENQEAFINRNYDEIKKMPEGAAMMERALVKIKERKNELINPKY